eukprot:2683152-Pleurochrysis_carterae.AAC.1
MCYPDPSHSPGGFCPSAGAASNRRLRFTAASTASPGNACLAPPLPRPRPRALVHAQPRRI